MVSLFEVDGDNWMEVAALAVGKEQERFLDRPVGILARGYAYRSCRARVFGISGDGVVVGAALVKDLDEEPACYDLQQFMIDERFQGRGYGRAALELILQLLGREGRYSQVEVCVNRENKGALRMYEKAGFVDTGYIDEDVPDCLNLMYHFSQERAFCSDTLVRDFSDPSFQTAFRMYFGELGMEVRDWDGLFREIKEEENAAFVRTRPEGRVIGFILFQPLQFSNSFFRETRGFIREFWVDSEFRDQGHGSDLLALAEKYFSHREIYTCILTTCTGGQFYEKHGYARAPGCSANNREEVYVKRLK